VKLPPIKNPVAFAVVDTDGYVRWGLVFSSLEAARLYAQHPMRRVVRIKVASVCRRPRGSRMADALLGKKRKAKRGGK
jgi:hypothetical protein